MSTITSESGSRRTGISASGGNAAVDKDGKKGAVSASKPGVCEKILEPGTTLRSLSHEVFQELMPELSTDRLENYVSDFLVSIGTTTLGGSVEEAAEQFAPLIFEHADFRTFCNLEIQGKRIGKGDNVQGKLSQKMKDAARNAVKRQNAPTAQGAMSAKGSVKSERIEPTSEQKTKVAVAQFSRALTELVGRFGDPSKIKSADIESAIKITMARSDDPKQAKGTAEHKQDKRFQSAVADLLVNLKDPAELQAIIAKVTAKYADFDGGEIKDIANSVIDSHSARLGNRAIRQIKQRLRFGSAHLRVLKGEPGQLKGIVDSLRKMGSRAAIAHEVEKMGLDQSLVDPIFNDSADAAKLLGENISDRVDKVNAVVVSVGGGHMVGMLSLFPDTKDFILGASLARQGTEESTLADEAAVRLVKRGKMRESADAIGRAAISVAAGIASGGTSWWASAGCAFLSGLPELGLAIGELEQTEALEAAKVVGAGTADAQRDSVIAAFAVGVALSGVKGAFSPGAIKRPDNVMTVLGGEKLFVALAKNKEIQSAGLSTGIGRISAGVQSAVENIQSAPISEIPADVVSGSSLANEILSIEGVNHQLTAVQKVIIDEFGLDGIKSMALFKTIQNAYRLSDGTQIQQEAMRGNLKGHYRNFVLGFMLSQTLNQ